MKANILLSLLLCTLILTAFCACSPPAKSETDRLTDEATESQDTPEDNDAEQAQEKADQALLYELAADFLPEETIESDPNWQQKIAPEIYASEIHENGKYAVYLSRKALPHNAEGKLYVKFSKQTGYFTEAMYARAAVGQRYFDRFAERYIENASDVIYQSHLTGSIILYASAEEIEKYARSYEVLNISVFVNEEVIEALSF